MMSREQTHLEQWRWQGLKAEEETGSSFVCELTPCCGTHPLMCKSLNVWVPAFTGRSLPVNAPSAFTWNIIYYPIWQKNKYNLWCLSRTHSCVAPLSNGRIPFRSTRLGCFTNEMFAGTFIHLDILFHFSSICLSEMSIAETIKAKPKLTVSGTDALSHYRCETVGQFHRMCFPLQWARTSLSFVSTLTGGGILQFSSQAGREWTPEGVEHNKAGAYFDLAAFCFKEGCDN